MYFERDTSATQDGWQPNAFNLKVIAAILPTVDGSTDQAIMKAINWKRTIMRKQLCQELASLRQALENQEIQ